MALPNWQEFMLPMLQASADGQLRVARNFENIAADALDLTEEERNALLPSGTMTVLRDRTGWAYYALFRAGLFLRPKRGTYQISERGKAVLSERPEKLDGKFLHRFPEYLAYRAGSGLRSETPADPSFPADVEEITPHHAIESAVRELRNKLAQDILDAIFGQTPAFFEALVVKLLVQMGYGGSRKDAGRAIGQSGDEGIDGVIKEDRLGLDIIYIQAKRWARDNKVSRADVQAFVGSLAGKQAHKGVFITTSNFQDSAREYVKHLSQKVSLIDGLELAELCIEFDIGAEPDQTYIVKRLDTSYFDLA